MYSKSNSNDTSYQIQLRDDDDLYDSPSESDFVGIPEASECDEDASLSLNPYLPPDKPIFFSQGIWDVIYFSKQF